MPQVLLNPLLWFAASVATWGLWRLARWVASGCRLPLRGRRGSAAMFGKAGLAAQVFYGPGAKTMIEESLREEVRRDEDDEGDPPDAGPA